MSSIVYEPLKLMRKDGKIVDAVYYNNADIENVEILNIKELKFEGKAVKDIKKADIHNAVLKNEDKIYMQNNKTKMVAGLSKKHLNKIISTIFTRDIESRYAYIKKELISNVDTIFYKSIPILFNTNIKDVYAGVVKDTFTITDKEYMRENNINSDCYFNSGVMLLNLSKLRNENISKKLIEDKLQYQTMFMDQDTFNKVFGNNVLFLSCKYNFLNYYLEVFSTESLSSFFDEKLKNDEDKLYKSCYILHFGGANKPWIHDMDLLTQIYKKYYKKSILRNKELKLKKCPYTRTFAEKLFSIKNNFSKTQKIITILGVKVKIKRGKSGK